MIKSIIKEIIVILLLLVAIILALGVLLYEYIPSNKIVPTVEKYSTSENVKQELEEKITEDETVLVTYEVTESDLNTYEKTEDYVKGKVNPFKKFEEAPADVNETDTDGNNDIDNANTSSQENNKNTFYNSTGTK